MFKNSIKFVLLFFFIMCSLTFCAGAECVHNFEPSPGNDNLFCTTDYIHYYYCLNGCGNYGTVSGGINSSEQCSFCFVSEEEATCVSEGKKLYMCTVCYLFKEETVAIREHKYKRIRRLPTCTEFGYDLYACTGCDRSFKDNFVQPLQHLSDGGVIETLPTYNKTGTIKVSCRVCGYHIERKTVPCLIKVEEKKNVAEKVTGFKVKSYGTSSVKLVWKKSENALSYKIYYSTDKKKWKTVSTDKTSITVKKLKSAIKYYFKISAVGEDNQSAVSKIISACTKPTKAVLLKIKSVKKSKATLEWKKLNNVSGYEVSYTSNSFKKKNSVKTVNVTKDSKKTLKSLKSGKKYFFRVRAYKNYGSKKIYGAYSKVKTLKIK